MSVQRRFFLKLSVAFPSLYLSGPLVAAVTSPDPLEAMLGGSEALCMIGSLYLQAKPGERAAALAWGSILTSHNAVDGRRHIARQAKADLEKGLVVLVGGWILPRSTALTCAALTLRRDAAGADGTGLSGLQTLTRTIV